MDKTLTLVCLLALMLSACSKENKLPSPNIILIMADDLGYGDIPSYGNKHIQTPNLDYLASEGVRFTDFHSNGSVCSPTRAALMTGKYQQRTGVEGVITAKSHREVGMSLDEISMADEFKKHGYQTGMFGKWHLGYAPEYNPVFQGFNEFVGFVSGNVDFQAHIDQEGYLDWWKGDRIANESGYTTDLITDYGVDFIQNNNPQKTAKPFFLYLPHEAPHYPYQNRKSKALREVGTAASLPVDKDSIPGLYKEMIEIMDEGIGRIIQSLKETGQYENTLIVFCSDNGASRNGSNGVLRGFKAGVYEGGSRVPAIISFPGKIPKGWLSEEVVLSMDYLPTFLDFIGKEASGDKIDGISIKDHLMHKSALPERDLFYAFKHQSFIRSGNYKLIRKKNEAGDIYELYDLGKDLQEKNNLVAVHPDIVKVQEEKLKKWEEEVHHGVTRISQ
ncbi:MAG: sulfatase-like hydrolase/transferase [Bacteroidia bacterium]|nr:sulfatase-like hydrolase/transferase [Bacteroidia bacterium]